MAASAVLFLLFTSACWARLSAGAGVVDLTRSPGAKGSVVVEAVVDLIHHSCIFADDKYFLRRLAFVESRDGTNGNTYRYQYDGGIWQVDNDKFLQTKSSPYARAAIRSLASSDLNIDWNQVTWNDLRKPLFSGLAARLYIEVMLRGDELPRDMNRQAIFWHESYHDSQPLAIANFTATAELLKTSCSADKELDAVFLLDSSGSVDISDFDRAKEFVIQWILANNMGPNATQLAVISYSTDVTIDFYLNTHNTVAGLIGHVRSIRYKGLGTNTGYAIDAVVDYIFKPENGARHQVPRAMILVTDGQSNDPQHTINATNRAKSHKITSFAIGVGSSIDKQELRDVATDPDCTHIFALTNFHEMEALNQEMQEASCHTLVDIGPTSTNNTTKGNSSKWESFTCREGKRCDVKVENPHTVDNNTDLALVTNVSCGSATVYASYNTPNPGAAYYELKAVASKNTPAVIYLDKSGKTLYVSVEGHPSHVDINRTVVCDAVLSIQEKQKPTSHELSVVCREGGKERPCTATDLTHTMPQLCKGQDPEFDNPCTRANLLKGLMKFTYPYDLGKYLMCDLAGNVYVVQCPNGHVYNFLSQSCGLGFGHPGNPSGHRLPLSKNVTNPCTVETILAGHIQFSYIPDNTKYITCDVWGNAWLNSCDEGFIWAPRHLQCVPKSVSGKVQGPGPLDKDVPNPCTRDHITAGRLFFSYPYAHDRYIQCDAWGDAYVMLCFIGGHWNDIVGACTAGNMT